MLASPSGNGFSRFVDRRIEQKQVYDFCNSRFGKENRCLIFRTKRDVGTTFFLQHLTKRLHGDWFTVYADCRSSDPECIFNKFFAELDQQPFLRWFALSPLKEIGKLFFQLVGAFLSYIPGWGRPAAVAVGGAIPNMAFTPYPSITSQRFAELITSGRWKRPIVFLVDNAQEIKPQSLNILKTAFSEQYDHVKFVLCFVEDDNVAHVEGFESRLTALGLGVKLADFPPPDKEFLNELASSGGVELPIKEQQDLLRQSEQRISRLITALSRLTKSLTVELTPLESEILRYLLVADQPLAEADMNALMLRSPRIAFLQAEVRTAITSLVEKGWLKCWKRQFGSEVEIAAGKGRYIHDVVSNPAVDMVAAQEIYRYLLDLQKNQGKRHAPSFWGGLLYRLAKQIDPQSLPQRALDLVRISLGQADLDAARYYLQEAVGKGALHTASDLYARLAFHISVQEYEEADSIFNQLGEAYWSQMRMLRIIHAVVSNRLRRHEEAIGEIDKLLSVPEATPEEWALLTSYKVAGLMHDGRSQEAAAEFELNRLRFKKASNLGYALRNCAAIFFWNPTKDVERAKGLLEQASEVFLRQNDRFGYLTTLNNQGALLASTASKELAATSALPIFQDAFDGLSIFGVQHLEEVGANLGICLLLAGQAESAVNHLSKLLAIVPLDFPRVLMESALAFAEAILGDISAARERMTLLTKIVHEVVLSEAIYRANVNAAAIEALAGDFGDTFQRYMEAAAGSNYWGGMDALARLKETASKGAMPTKGFLLFFSCDFFQYWSQNPLSVLSPAYLPEETISSDMF